MIFVPTWPITSKLQKLQKSPTQESHIHIHVLPFTFTDLKTLQTKLLAPTLGADVSTSKANINPSPFDLRKNKTPDLHFLGSFSS